MTTNAATLEREKQDVDNPTGMLHIERRPHGCGVALCGTKKPPGTRYYPPSQQADCVVCESLEANALR